MFRKQIIRMAARHVIRVQPRPYAYAFTWRYTAPFSSEQFEFKAETKKLLEIVANSLYKDKDVFVRELLSNASDALEKYRFMAVQKEGTTTEGLDIRISLDEEKRVITIQDGGIGMTKQEMIDNLGTIARSGSREFVSSSLGNSAHNIIGQFGVGFYSSFIVGHTVDVTSRHESDAKAYTWTSDGSGHFQVRESDEIGFPRGTRVSIFLKPDCAQFAKRNEIEKIIERYSNFIAFPITLNGQLLERVQAIWSKSKSDVTAEEHQRFFEYLSGSKNQYFYKLHYQTDAPLGIKALLYIPLTPQDRFQMMKEDMNVHLYSRNIVIKKNCTELLPHFLRFVCGIVDCEDLPLNVSRENYQDTAFMAKLKSIIAKRLITEIQNEANRDPTKYLGWYEQYQFYLKEGIASEPTYAEQLMPLLRFQHNTGDGYISLDEYIKKLQPGQDTIYFLSAPTRELALRSPYLEPFRGSDVPVLLSYIHIDEMVFTSVNAYKNFKFVNIENQQEDIMKKFVKDVQHDTVKGLPIDEIAPLSLWLKNELAPQVTLVQVSKRLKDTPAIVVSKFTSGMRQVMGMVDKTQTKFMSQNLTLEINPNHPLIVQLNNVRRTNQQVASTIAKALLDNCLLVSGLLEDPQDLVQRSHALMELVIQQAQYSTIPQVDATSHDTHPIPETHTSQQYVHPTKEEADVVLDEHGNPTTKK